MTDRPTNGPSGYAVHPSFAAPIRLTPAIGTGVTTSLMGDWPDRFSEDEQEVQLRATWNAVCKWAEENDVDCVYVDSFPPEHAGWFLTKGFTAPSGKRASRSGLQYAGSAHEVARRMSEAFAVPTLFLSASSAGREIVRVEDLSWDSVFVFSDQPPALFR